LGGRRLLVIKQRKRKQVPVCWHLLFCRLFNESAYRHLGLQFNNLFVCRNPTSPKHPFDVPTLYHSLIPSATFSSELTRLLLPFAIDISPQSYYSPSLFKNRSSLTTT